MKPLAVVGQAQMNRMRQDASIPVRLILTLLFSFAILIGHAQSVSWSDSFVQNQEASLEQCQKWTAFLDQLGKKKFVSVTFSGSQDPIGKTITDPVAATELARRLYQRDPGIVTVGEDTWVVSTCGASSCGTQSVALSWNGNVVDCQCTDQYAVKPHTGGTQWGGLNSESCNAVSQDFSLVFNSGVTITALGSTTFCKGEKVTLVANADICSGGPYTYLWSTGEQTASIEASSTGDYSVTVYGPDKICSAVSETVHVTVTETTLTVTEAFTLCDAAVNLFAQGSSTGSVEPIVNKYCLFDIGDSNCSFTTRICSDGYRQIVNESFTQTLPSAKPSEINLRLYYNQANGQSEFTFRINGQWLSTFLETDAPNSCFPVAQYPRTFTFKEAEFEKLWNPSGDNTVTVEILADNGAVFFAGIVVETVLPGETYSWTPTEGLLSSPFIANPLAKPSATTTYTVTYADASGCKTSRDVLVTVKCSTIPCKQLTVPVAANCLAEVDPMSLYDGVPPLGMTFVAEPAGPYAPGVYDIEVTGTLNGVNSACLTRLTVIDDVKPTIILKDITVNNDAGQCYATVNLLDPFLKPVISDNCGVGLVTKDKADDKFYGITQVNWTVTDIHGNQQMATQTVTVVNVAPVISSVVASATSVAVNLPVTLTTTYVDDNVNTATIEWGDASAVETVTNPGNVFAVSHAYSASGSYSVKIALTDACGSLAYIYQSIVVFNQLGASVNGNGWFESAPGYYQRNKRASGKASFSFEAQINSYSGVPAGRATFNFKSGNLRFRSTEYQWLVIDEQTATLKGYGVVGNTPGYEILISMVNQVKPAKEEKNKGPKQTDQIRIKISDPVGVVIYDTQLGSPDDAIATTPISGGSIEIKQASSNFNETYESPVASSFGEESTSAYPNPFNDWMEVKYSTGSPENVIIELLDLAGKVVFNEIFPVSVDGSYSFELPENTNDQPGIYILTIKQGKKVKILRVVRN